MNLIALVGFIGSGKDTVGRRLVEEHGFHDMAFADALKDTCAAIFCWDRDLLDGKNPQSREWRDQIDPWWAKKLEIPQFTPRWALQNLGTDVLRRYVSDNLWILNINRRIDTLRDKDPDAKIVLTDGRFPNELKMIRDLGGSIIRIKRGDEPQWFQKAKLANQFTPKHIDRKSLLQLVVNKVIPPGIFPMGPAFVAYFEMQNIAHVSEWAWVSQNMDYTIPNDTTIDDLYRMVDFVVLENH